MWSEKYLMDRTYQKLDLIIIINASPYEIGKFDTRKKLASKEQNVVVQEFNILKFSGFSR